MSNLGTHTHTHTQTQDILIILLCLVGFGAGGALGATGANDWLTDVISEYESFPPPQYIVDTRNALIGTAVSYFSVVLQAQKESYSASICFGKLIVMS